MILKSQDSNPKVPMNFEIVVGVGIFLVVALFGGLAVWAYGTELASAVVAQGQVTVDSNRKSVQHAEGGVVSEIKVRDGDIVKVGQTLIVLSEARPRANYGIIKSNLDTLWASEVRLIAERDGKTVLKFPGDRFDKSDPEIRDLIDGQNNLFKARRDATEGQRQILQKRIHQHEQVMEGLRAQQASKERQISLITEELADLNNLLKEGVASKPRILELDRRKASLEGERGELIADIARTEQNIGETKLEILQLDKKFRESVVEELRDVKTKMLDYTERLAAAEDTLNHIVIRAPVTGTVVGLSVHNKDAVISPGQMVAEIVPENDALVIEAKIKPSDIDNLIVGSDADVRITGFDRRSTPTLKGTFAYVSADSLTDPQTRVSYFKARVHVSDDELKRLGAKKLLPGMPAEIMINTGSRTPLNYLLEPVLLSMNRAMRE